MTTTSLTLPAAPRRGVIRVVLSRPVGATGLAIILFFLLCAIAAPIIAPYDPAAQDLRNVFATPSAEHWLGTDTLGRDILSRLIWGARIALIVGLGAVAIGVVIGGLLGACAGYFGRVVDSIIMRVVDAMMAFPPLLIALAFGAALGGGLENIVLALGVGFVPAFARMMRGQVLAIRSLDFVVASELNGASSGRVLFTRILPNSISPIVILVTLDIGVAILAESGLSFLGIGVRPPTATWGAMVSEGYRYLLTYPMLSLAPGVCIVIVVLAFNFLGDALRDALDPKIRGTLR